MPSYSNVEFSRPRTRSRNCSGNSYGSFRRGSSSMTLNLARPNTVTCTIVGDGGVGKTSITLKYHDNNYPDDYVPTVFDTYVKTISWGDGVATLTVQDTAGQDEYDRIRALQYPTTDVFIVCFSLESRESFENIDLKWFPEIVHFCPHKPIILVGTKTDIQEFNPKPITMKECMAKSRAIRSSAYLQCSARNRTGVDEIFEFAVNVVLNPDLNQNLRKKPSTCKIF